MGRLRTLGFGTGRRNPSSRVGRDLDPPRGFLVRASAGGKGLWLRLSARDTVRHPRGPRMSRPTLRRWAGHSTTTPNHFCPFVVPGFLSAWRMFVPVIGDGLACSEGVPGVRCLWRTTKKPSPFRWFTSISRAQSPAQVYDIRESFCGWRSPPQVMYQRRIPGDRLAALRVGTMRLSSPDATPSERGTGCPIPLSGVGTVGFGSSAPCGAPSQRTAPGTRGPRAALHNVKSRLPQFHGRPAHDLLRHR